MRDGVDELSPDATRDLFGPEAQAGGTADEAQANKITAPNPPDDDSDIVEPIERYRGLMAALYGSDFPLLEAFDKVTSENENFRLTGNMPMLEEMLVHCQPSDWAHWARGRWAYHASAVQNH